MLSHPQPRPRRLHYRWWAPAERFSFLKPWGDGPVTDGAGRGGLGGHGGYGGYAPPRPSAAPQAAAATRPEYDSSFDGRDGSGGGGGGGGGAMQTGGMNTGVTDTAASATTSAAAASAAAAAADDDADADVPKDENTSLLETNGSEGLKDLEDIFSSEAV